MTINPCFGFDAVSLLLEFFFTITFFIFAHWKLKMFYVLELVMKERCRVCLSIVFQLDRR